MKFKDKKADLLLKFTDKESQETAEYKGESVILNKPFETPDSPQRFAVYAKNSKGDVVKVRFGDPRIESQEDSEKTREAIAKRHKCELQKDKSTPSYWLCRMYGQTQKKVTDFAFKQKGFFDLSTKKMRSVRDGVQEYLGIEIGLEPHNKVFKVYRSPETIADIVGLMDNLPIIQDHIDPEIKPTKEQTIGIVTDTEIVSYDDETTDSTVVLENRSNVSSKVLELVSSGKKELSLGYLSKVVEHDVYDFEQTDIIPTHLGIVSAARGGSVLTFLDKEGSRMELEKMLMLAAKLQEVLKKSTPEELAEYVPMFEKIGEKVQADQTEDMEGMESTEELEEKEESSEDMESTEEKVEDMEKTEDEEEKEMTSEDSEEEKEEYKDMEKVKDSKSFKDAVAEAVAANSKEYIKTVEKARSFLDSKYPFEEKTAKEIKIDTLSLATGETFADNEIDTAFKLLKKNDKYSTFGDSQSEEEKEWNELENKEF